MDRLTRHAALAALCASAVLLIPLERWLSGGLLWCASALLAWRSSDAKARRRLGALLGCVLLLALAPINTDTSTPHFLSLGLAFLAAVVGPSLVLARTDPGVIRYRLLPRRVQWLELGYVALSVPLAWAALKAYFSLSPEVAFNWSLPPTPDTEALTRLFVGINAVGIWDELFFVNVSFAILRSAFSFGVANLAQAVIYTAVLYDMAFTGVGPLFVYVFALTQGVMFERTENLLYVLAVHLIVDYFLFQEIVAAYYPGFSAWWHPSF